MAKEAGLFESMALGGMAASFAVNFTHPIVRMLVVASMEKSSFVDMYWYLSLWICQDSSPTNIDPTRYTFQETVKTRMQVSGLGISHTVSHLYKTQGLPAFWNGLFFAYGRELSYTSVKLGAYAPVRNALGDGKDAPFYIKFLAGAITGGVGSAIGNPFDVLKTLAQTSKDKSPLGQQVMQMYMDQGIGGFYRGVGVNIVRACVLNATKMVRI